MDSSGCCSKRTSFHPQVAFRRRSNALDIVVGKGASVLELFSGKDQTLLVLDLGLDGLGGIRGLYLQSDGLSSKGLHGDLHSTTKAEHQVEGELFLDVVVGKGAAILE